MEYQTKRGGQIRIKNKTILLISVKVLVSYEIIECKLFFLS